MVVWVALTSTGFLIPIAVWLAVRWALVAPVVELEDRAGREALRRSAELVRGHWRRVGSLVGVGAGLALVAGPFLGALLIFVTNSSLALLNLVAGIVYAVALPFVALVTSYVYFDLRTRHELEPQSTPTSCRPRSPSRDSRGQRGSLLTRCSRGPERLPHTYTLQAGKRE